MARGGVNKAVVKIARNALLARGLRPSIDAVRVELGNTGSKTTIQRYLKELAEVEAPSPEIPLGEELLRYISSLVQRVKQEATDALAQERAAFANQQAEAIRKKQIEDARAEQVLRAHAVLAQERREGIAQEETLRGQLRVAELELHRLQEAQRQQLTLLEERASQIKSLEDKCRNAQLTLDHYREQHVRQREQESQRHESQILQAQHELRTVHDQLHNKQEELSQLYRDLERISGEQQMQNQKQRLIENSALVMKEQLQKAQLQHQNDLDQLQAMTSGEFSLRAKIKQLLQRQRHDQRQIRTLEEKIFESIRRPTEPAT